MTTPLESRIDELIELNLFTTDNLVVSSGGDRDQLKQAANVWTERITSIQQQDPETVLAELRRTYHEKLEQLWSLSTQKDDITQQRNYARTMLESRAKVTRIGDPDEMLLLAESGFEEPEPEPDPEAIAHLQSLETQMLPIDAKFDSAIAELDWIPSELAREDVDRLIQGDNIDQVIDSRCHQQYAIQRQEQIAALQSQLAVINEARQQALVHELAQERALQQMMNQPPTTTKD